jgi:hypothetical protein
MKSRALPPFAHYLIAYGLYLVAAIVVTWPLVMVLATRLVGHPFGDSYEYARHVWWIKHALQTGAPLFHDSLLAYPDGLGNSWLWGNPLQSFPAGLLAFILPLPAAFNLPLLFNLALNGWAVYVFVTYLTGQRSAAWLAGLVFLAYPTFQGQLAAGHTGLLVLWGVPLYTYGLFRLRETPKRRWLLFTALFFCVSLLGNTLLLVYMLLPITALFGLSLLGRREWPALRWSMGAVITGGLFALPFALPVALDMLSTPAWLQESGDVMFSADLLAVVSPSFQHPVFGQLAYTHSVLGRDPFEKMAYIGITAALLALVAVWRNRAARWWLLLGGLVWVGSLGGILKVMDAPLAVSAGGYETFIALPGLILQHIPLLSSTRTPSRFNFTLALAVAVLAGYGLAALWPRLGRRLGYVVCAGLSVFVLWEYQGFWSQNGLPDLPTIPGVVPESITALAGQDDIRAVFDIPWEHLLTDKDALYLQTGHQHPLIAGHITRRTPVDPARLSVLQNTLNPALLDAAGADIIILHKQWSDSDGVLDAFARQQLGDPFYEDERIAAFNAPPVTGAPGFLAVVPPTTTLRDSLDIYLYTPAPGWVELSAAVRASERAIGFWRDGQLVETWPINGAADIRGAVFLEQPGYHTLTLTVTPPCPADTGILVCAVVSISGLAVVANPGS